MKSRRATCFAVSIKVARPARSGNIHHHQLVRTLAVLHFGELARVACIALINELDPLYHAVFAAQTWDDAFS
jgi:hypothetical protein